eukprot:CAMPEP_0201716660 /NCGR_PEP_ID=MMETSP0593-20130828/2586_1 /ASSEMBLY_ACC=CAM_ASM_000672 /TAXON_ID=267983 /ORGANISM="Skeletonema japonicum, Strain CCMP2506" /LENGTH=166 /DNA_ID=CAMNT_0048206511 /DNA_START=12 /DNA_END=512 /DNA_ORIENTATION=+
MKMINNRLPYAAATILLALFASAGVVSSFTTTTPSRAASRSVLSNQQPWKFISSKTTQQTFVSHPADTTTTSLQMSGGTNPDVDTDGTDAGKYLLFLVLLVNVWAFSIPVEFRRARFCTEEQVRLNSDSHCITFDNWKSGIIDYYANGGGAEFDFSVEEGNKWIGS